MYTVNCKGKLLLIDSPIVMGIINTTPDSFYAASRQEMTDGICQKAEQMLKEGASILDIGGQSTRPGSKRIEAEEELDRVIPAIEACARHFPNALLSVDTYYASVVRAAIPAGASIVNDISGGSLDKEMIPVVGSLGTPFICMHMLGIPETMQQSPSYEDMITEIMDFFIRQMASCEAHGIADIILDPGFGFGKANTHNFQLLKSLHLFRQLGKPLLVGISRKGMVYKSLGITPEEALNGTTVLHTLALMQGANILRVHDVGPAMEAIRLFEMYQDA